MNSQTDGDFSGDRLMSLSEVAKLLNISHSSLYRLRRNKALNFPKAVFTGTSRICFSSKAICLWIEERKGNAALPEELKASTELMKAIRGTRK